MIISPWYILHLLAPVVLRLGVSDIFYILHKKGLKWPEMMTAKGGGGQWG